MLMQTAVEGLIKGLSLERHPEGGYYRQTYRSKGTIPVSVLPAGFTGSRSFATGIYFLLAGDDFSAFHRIRSDEMWHFYAGSSLIIHVIHPGGEYDQIRLGRDILGGEVFQAVVTGGCWFAAHLNDPSDYALVGCTVAPGFDFDDFELADCQDLNEKYPQHAAIITKLTRI
jgi:uncharacterized protein